MVCKCVQQKNISSQPCLRDNCETGTTTFTILPFINESYLDSPPSLLSLDYLSLLTIFLSIQHKTIISLHIVFDEKPSTVLIRTPQFHVKQCLRRFRCHFQAKNISFPTEARHLSWFWSMLGLTHDTCHSQKMLFSFASLQAGPSTVIVKQVCIRYMDFAIPDMYINTWAVISRWWTPDEEYLKLTNIDG